MLSSVSVVNYFHHPKIKLTVDGLNDWRHLSARLESHVALKTAKTIDRQHQKLLGNEARQWKDILKRLIADIGGSSDKLFGHNNGHYLKLFELFGQFDIIILDCYPDISKTEQMTILVRFFHVTSQMEHIVSKNVISLGIVPVAYDTSSTLTNTVLEILEKIEDPIIWYERQAFRATKKNLDMNKRAFYMPCSSHSLNIVLNDAVMSSQYAVTLSVLKNHFLNLTLKPLSNTRWENRIKALTPLRYQIGQVYDSFVDIGENIDCMTAHEAKSLANLMKDNTFISSFVIWYDVLLHINVVSKSHQSITSDVSDAICTELASELELEDMTVGGTRTARDQSSSHNKARMSLFEIQHYDTNGKRSFSKLTLIKTYLRSAMLQSRLSGLVMISSEHQMAEKIDYAETVK
ncbi:hypothetical protein PR048_032853, partial [Dryococelus australis]